MNITIVKDGVAEDYEELTVSIDVTPDFFDVLIDTATITIYDHDCKYLITACRFYYCNFMAGSIYSLRVVKGVWSMALMLSLHVGFISAVFKSLITV